MNAPTRICLAVMLTLVCCTVAVVQADVFAKKEIAL